MTTPQTTKTLWTETHEALCAGEWSQARKLLDELGTRRDNHDRLCSASDYHVPAMLTGVIGDRIDLVNSHV